MYFIRDGSVLLYNRFMVTEFLKLPKYSFFGDYQIIEDLKSNIVFKTSPGKINTLFMCVDRKTLLRLLKIFPKTHEMLRNRSLNRRLKFLEQMKRLDDQSELKALPVEI